jgi:hypothetical protein
MICPPTEGAFAQGDRPPFPRTPTVPPDAETGGLALERVRQDRRETLGPFACPPEQTGRSGAAQGLLIPFFNRVAVRTVRNRRERRLNNGLGSIPDLGPLIGKT